MNIHTHFTFNHFIISFVILLAVYLVLIKIKKRNIKEFLSIPLIVMALVITAATAFYSEDFCSGMYCGKRYGFPRQIFEISYYIGKEQVDVVVMSKFSWNYFLQNFLLILVFLNVLKISIKKALG